MTYKHVYMAIKTTDSTKIAAAIDRVSTNPERIMLISEPQSISIMVDRTITEDFRLPSGHMTDAMLSILMPGSGWRDRNFNAQFQSRFYPDRRGGMGNSSLAEVWAWGNAPAVVLAAVAWCGLLLVLTLLFSSTRDGLARAAMMLVGLLWAVNVHRNDLRYTIVLSVAVLVLFALTTLVAALWRMVLRYRRARLYAGAGGVRAMNTIKIVYITGFGRSGSTLLDILLASAPSAFGCGELNALLREGIFGGDPCACGEPVANCPLWQDVMNGWSITGDAASLNRYSI